MASHSLSYLVRVDSKELTGLRTEAARVAKTLGLVGPETAKGSKVAGAALDNLTRKTREAATARIATDAKIRRGLEQQLGVYQRVAATAKKGSAEQVAAANLADRALRRLGVDGELAGRRVGSGARTAERDLSRVARGALLASGALRGIGRGAVIGGFSFLAGAGIVSTLRRILEDSEDVVQSQKQLDTQLAASGLSASRYGAQIDKVVTSQARLAKVDEEDVKRALTTEVRATGDLRESYGLVALALDLAAAKHLDLAAAAQVEAKVATGNVGILRRQGIAISKNATVTEALRQEQKQLAGQALATANTAGGAFRGFGLAVENVREALGEGLLPVLEKDLNQIADKLNDPQTKAAVEKFARGLSEDIEGALHDIADFFEQHWPDIKRDFTEGADDVKFLAGRLQELLTVLDKIAHLVPASDSLVKLLLLGSVVGKVTGVGKAGAAAGAERGGASALLESSGIAGLLTGLLGRRSRSSVVNRTLEAAGAAPVNKKIAVSLPEILQGGGRIARFARLGVVTLAIDLALSKHDRNQFLGGARDELLGKPGIGPLGIQNTTLRHVGVPKEISDLITRGTADFLTLGGTEVARHFFGHGEDKQIKDKVEKAIADGGADGSRKAAAALERRIVEGARTAAQNLRDKLSAALDTSLKTVSDKALQAFDGATDTLLTRFDDQTDAILTAFDDQTRKLEQNLSVTVKVPTLHEAFKVTVTGKTPAERELDALDKLSAKRNATRDLQDANEELAQARAIGSPKAIEAAQRKVEDARDELHRQALTKRAATERTAADKAIKARTDHVEKQRSVERDSAAAGRASLRRDLDARRQLEREHFQASLAGLTKELEAGNLTAAEGQRKILATLAKYGVNYKQAGVDLGKAFASGLGDEVGKATRQVGKLRDAVEKLTRLEKPLERMAKSFEIFGRAGDKFVSTPALAALTGQGQKTAPGVATAPTAGSADAQTAHDEKVRAHAEARAGRPTRRAILDALHRINAPAFNDRLVPKRGEPTGPEYDGFLQQLDPSTRKLLRRALRQQGFFRARRGGVAPGDGRPDTTLSLLTRGEVVLTDDDQERLRRALGIGGGPHELLAGIRRLPRFAAGGVVPAGDGLSIDDLVELMIEQLAGREVARSRATKLHGRPVPHPLHVEQLVRKSGPLSALPAAKKLALEQRLAQLQAHPALFGLASTHPDGPETLGPAGRSGRLVRRSPPVGQIGAGTVGSTVFEFHGDLVLPNVRNGKQFFDDVRKESVRKASRNGRRVGHRTTLGDKAPR